MVSKSAFGARQQAAASGKRPRLTRDVLFFSRRCAPCRKMEPVLRDWQEGMAENDEDWMVRFVKVDVDRHARIAHAYHVTAMPTFVVFLNAEAKYTVRGANKKKLRERIESAMQVAFDERNARGVNK